MNETSTAIQTTSRADQPRLTTESLQRESGALSLQYRVQSLGQTYGDRSSPQRSYGRKMR